MPSKQYKRKSLSKNKKSKNSGKSRKSFSRNKRTRKNFRNMKGGDIEGLSVFMADVKTIGLGDERRNNGISIPNDINLNDPRINAEILSGLGERNWIELTSLTEYQNSKDTSKFFIDKINRKLYSHSDV